MARRHDPVCLVWRLPVLAAVPATNAASLPPVPLLLNAISLSKLFHPRPHHPNGQKYHGAGVAPPERRDSSTLGDVPKRYAGATFGGRCLCRPRVHL